MHKILCLREHIKRTRYLGNKAILSAIENFKDYKLDSVDDFK